MIRTRSGLLLRSHATIWSYDRDFRNFEVRRHPLGAQLAEFVAAIDQGTTSTRCMIFDHDGAEVARHQLEHEQILPRAGWVEHNPVEIWERTASTLMSVLNATNLGPGDIAALGITNQRETTLVWNRKTGRPYYNAIVWQDTRTDRIASALDRDGRGDVIRRKAGLPPATYFSGGKLQWILENVDGVRQAAEHGDAIFGTADTWVFFGPPPVDGAMADRWGLGFGPTGGELPRWSLFHTVGPDRFDEHVECPYPAPLDPVLLRWSTSVVGRRTAALLLGSVGSCLDFYRQYFAERPDLGVPVGPWARGLRPSAIPPIRSLVSSSDPYEANE